MTDSHNRFLGNRALSPETLMMGYGYDPFLSERLWSAAVSSKQSCASAKPIELLRRIKGRSSPNEGAHAVGGGIAELNVRIHSPPGGSPLRT